MDKRDLPCFGEHEPRSYACAAACGDAWPCRTRKAELLMANKTAVELPEFLVHKDPVVRAAAKKRLEELGSI